jgi:hypothetical protein
MVQSNAIVFGWNRVVPGREGLAAELFGVATAFYEVQRTTGKIESWEPIFLERHGGDFNGFFVIKGTHAQLDTLSASDEFRDIIFRADHYLQGVGVIEGFTGSTIAEMMQRWTKTIPTR